MWRRRREEELRQTGHMELMKQIADCRQAPTSASSPSMGRMVDGWSQVRHPPLAPARIANSPLGYGTAATAATFKICRPKVSLS